ncbi:LysR family transcriptional regulator [Fluoribacter gormanii]|uniref:LysR family transcriptional regulator n=1 Tax=Fluoribacter gormanii TaxID=464 RepID=UPI001041480C|nr:LysR family transcriptional regulator [Fluoribacter gormanii]
MDKLKQTIKIGTLGPKGTSSEAALAHFIQTFKKESENYSTILLNSFQSVLHELIYGDLSLAIVPHAYSAINLFYINPQISLYRMFTFNTPPYGLAKRSDGIISQHHCRVVSHPAPAHLLELLLAQMELSRYEIAFVNSTSKAAEEVYENRADLALTNMNAIKKYELDCCAWYGAIQMGWSVFIKKDLIA